jgi:hypothetical protein
LSPMEGDYLPKNQKKRIFRKKCSKSVFFKSIVYKIDLKNKI